MVVEHAGNADVGLEGSQPDMQTRSTCVLPVWPRGIGRDPRRRHDDLNGSVITLGGLTLAAILMDDQEGQTARAIANDTAAQPVLGQD